MSTTVFESTREFEEKASELKNAKKYKRKIDRSYPNGWLFSKSPNASPTQTRHDFKEFNNHVVVSEVNKEDIPPKGIKIKSEPMEGDYYNQNRSHDDIPPLMDEVNNRGPPDVPFGTNMLKEYERIGREHCMAVVKTESSTNVQKMSYMDTLSGLPTKTNGFEVRSMQDWVSTWFTEKNQSIESSTTSILDDINKVIDEKTTVKKGSKNNGNIKSKAVIPSGSSETQTMTNSNANRPNAMDTSTQNHGVSAIKDGKEEIITRANTRRSESDVRTDIKTNEAQENELGEMFSNMNMNEDITLLYNNTRNAKFGNKNPEEYQLFKYIAEVERKKDLLYRNEARSYMGSEELALPDFTDAETDKEYNKDFLRESKGLAFGERHCRYMDKCVFNILPSVYPDHIEEHKAEDAFICREYLLPKQLTEWKKSKKLPLIPQACLGCNRVTHTYRYIYRLKNKIKSRDIIHDHVNKVEGPWGYNKNQCLYFNPNDSDFQGVGGWVVRFDPKDFQFGKATWWVKTDTYVELKCVKEDRTPLNF